LWPPGECQKHRSGNISKNCDLTPVFLEIGEVAPIVLLGKEAGLAVVAALDYMLRDPGEIEAGLARHEPPPCGLPVSVRNTGAGILAKTVI
jgi:hypothetical protein